LLAGCGGSSDAGGIKHVVIIMQENRSVDNLFNGFPGADTVQTGMDKGNPIQLTPITLAAQFGLDHTHPGWWKDWDHGMMDGFGHPFKDVAPAPPDAAYSYVPKSETVPLWKLAEAYTFGDRMFQSNTGPSFPAHLYMVAGQAGDVSGNPDNFLWGCDAAPTVRAPLLGPDGTNLPDGAYPCFDFKTIADEFDTYGITWRYYAPQINNNGLGGTWSVFQAIKHIRFGPNWKSNIVSPQTRFLQDINNGKLAQVTWICPDYAHSDHMGPGSTPLGPEWVATVVNAIGRSPYWYSTAIFVSWDDWDGFYDHVPPPQVDDMGLGFRVPLIVVSPYAKHGYVSHQVHEFSSFLRFAEELYKLPSLGTRDATADDLADCFDFTRALRPCKTIEVSHGADFFIHAAPTGPGDDDRWNPWRTVTERYAML
jgi:phospholipase C